MATAEIKAVSVKEYDILLILVVLNKLHAKLAAYCVEYDLWHLPVHHLVGILRLEFCPAKFCQEITKDFKNCGLVCTEA